MEIALKFRSAVLTTSSVFIQIKDNNVCKELSAVTHLLMDPGICNTILGALFPTSVEAWDAVPLDISR